MYLYLFFVADLLLFKYKIYEGKGFYFILFYSLLVYPKSVE